MKRIPAVLGTMSLASVLVLAACSSETTDTEPEAASTADLAGQTVQLLTHDSFALSDDVIADFESSTGVTLELVSGGDAGSMVAGAILAAGAPTADVIFGVDNTLVTRALDSDVFEAYTSTEAGALRPELAERSFDGRVTPIDFGDVCINIDDTYFAAEGIAPPTTLDDLTDPQYRDLLVVQDPGTSSPGLAFALSTVSRYGDGWVDYWQRLRDNGVKVAGSWSDAYYGDFTFGGGGDRPIVVSYATSPPAEIVYAEGEGERVLRAVQVVVDEKLARPILVGRPAVLEKRIEKFGLRLKLGQHVDVINPDFDERYRDYWQTYYEIAKRKGVTIDLV